MRFSTVAILAFIAYASNQALAAPVPPHSQSIEGHHAHHKSGHGHGRHAHDKQARLPVHDAEENEESGDQTEEPESTEHGHSHHLGRHSRHHRYQEDDSESPSVPQAQDIQARSPFPPLKLGIDGRYHYPHKRDLQTIEARSPRHGQGSPPSGGSHHHGQHSQQHNSNHGSHHNQRQNIEQPQEAEKRDLQAIEARSPKSRPHREGPPQLPASAYQLSGKRDLQAIEARSPGGSYYSHPPQGAVTKRYVDELD